MAENKYPTRTEFFINLGKLEISIIKKELLLYVQNSKDEFNELVTDFEYYLKAQIGIVPDVIFDETIKEFTDYKVDDLRPLTRDEVLHYVEFDWWDRNLLFDFINIEIDFITVKRLKVSCKWENETERIHKFENGAFKFREACKMVISELLEPQKPTEDKKDFKKQYWFEIGLKFATGEINKLLKDKSASAVARELGNKDYRPYISESLSDTNTTDKNIFSKPDKLKKIYAHCIENKIDMCDFFLNKYNQIESD